MGIASRIAGGIFGLILLYLVVNNADTLNALFSTTTTALNKEIAALQGR